MHTQPTLDLDLPPEPPRAAAPAEFRTPASGPTYFHTMDSPAGELLLTGDGQSLTGLWMRPPGPPGADWRRDPTAFTAAEAQLSAYFAGELHSFSLPLAPHGSAFQLRVWRALTTIPHGATTSYGALADTLGLPNAARAVGLANGRNPISIIVPCHRVIGADGSLTGYGGGLPRKSLLLRLEGARFRG